MAFGSIELGTIARAQDYTTMKHNEDNKVFVEQSNLGIQQHKNAEQKIHQVNTGDDTRWQNKKFDAKEKGDNEYSGDGGKKRKKEKSHERMVVKGHQGFDMKI